MTRDGDVLLTGTRGPGMPLALHLLDPSGDLVWTYDPVASIRITEAEADPDGGAYVVTNTRFLHSVGAGGGRRWVREIVGRVDYGPIVHPDGESVVVVATGVEGTRLVSVKPEGALGWQIPLSSLDGVPIPTSRLRVAESGGRVYLPTIFLGSDDRWALYAIDTPASQAEGTGGTWGGGGTGGSGGDGGSGGTSGSGGDGGSGGTSGSGGDGGSGGTSGSGGDGGTGGISGSGGSAPGASGGDHASRPTGGCSASGAQGPTSLALAIAVGVAITRRRLSSREAG